MRFASIAVLLLLTTGCDREKAGNPPAEASRVAPHPGAAQPAAEAATAATAQSEPAAAAPAAPPGVETTPATPQPAAQPEAPATPRPRPAAEPSPSAAAPAPRAPQAAALPAAETPTGPTGPAAAPAAQVAPQTATAVVPAPPAASGATSAAPIAPIAATLAEPPAAAAELDLKALQDQLRQTKAIGFMTKLTLKGQVDDLLSRFDDHYRGRTKETMKDLRRAFDLLMMKVLSLLQDADQQLASAIVASREAIWGLLADPVKFETLQG
jgi:hypothetical protein